MLEGLRTKSNALGTAVLCVALVGSVVAMATRNEGYKETRVDLHEAGIWVTNRSLVSRFNTEISEHEPQIQLDLTGDVAQSGSAVVAFATQERKLKGIDPVLEVPLQEPVELPKQATVAMGGDTGVVTDRASGRVWATSASGLGEISVSPVSALYKGEKGEETLTAVGVDGRIHVYQAGRLEVRSFDGPGDRTPVISRLERPITSPQLSAVGGRAVLLDRGRRQVVVVGGATTAVGKVQGDLALQQPGPAVPSVLVSGDDQLVAVPVDGGPVEVLARGGGGGPVSPLEVGGCSYGAWSVEARYARICDHEQSPLPDRGVGRVGAETIRGIAPQSRIALRTNHQRAVLNAIDDGSVFTIDVPDPDLVPWPSPEGPVKRGDQAPQEEQQKDCKEQREAPSVAKSTVERGTRSGRPVVFDVLQAGVIGKSDCGVAVVVLDPKALPDPETEAVVALLDNDTKIQVTPRKPAGTVSVPFRMSGVGGQPSDVVTLRVAIDDEAENPPETTPDETIVAAGRTVTHDVLANDFDPDGDSLRLVEMKAQASDGAPPVFQANGTISYQGATPGVHTFDYTVMDERDQSRSGEIAITVTGKQAKTPPKAVPDVLVMKAGTVRPVDVLANDTDDDTDHSLLKLKALKAPVSGLAVERDPLDEDGGKLTVEATGSAGDYVVEYSVSDGDHPPVPGRLFVKVEAAGANQAPVAVRDDVFVRPTVATVVDVMANDFDADGDVLAVTDVTSSAVEGVSVEVVELRALRVVTPAGFTAPTTVSYWLSDGINAPVEGSVVVAPHESRVVNQPPVAVDDATTVRAGRWTAVDVLRNDIDPEGEQLELAQAWIGASPDGAAPAGDDGDLVSVKGKQIRIRPASGPARQLIVRYQVKDPGVPAKTDDGLVTVDVRAADQDDPPPQGQVIVMRARAGEPTPVPISLLDLDPDGDPVAVLGANSAQPPLMGQVQLTDDRGLVYEPDPDQPGGLDTFQVDVKDAAHDPVAVTIKALVIGRSTRELNPVARPDRLSIEQGSAPRLIDVLANDTDPEEGALTLLDGPDDGPSGLSEGGGTVEVVDQKVRYTPPSSVVGDSAEFTFTYTVNDPGGLQGVGLVRVTVRKQAVREPPVAIDDIHAAVEPNRKVRVDVLANDRDPDDDNPAFEVRVLDAARHPEIALVKGVATVEVGDEPVQFGYEITDRDGKTDQALVVIPVVDVLRPVAKLDEAKVAAGRSTTIAVLDNDSPKGKVHLTRVFEKGTGGMATKEKEGPRAVFNAATDATRGGFSYLIQDAESHQEAVGRVRVTITGGSGAAPSLASPAPIEVTPGAPERRLDLARWARDADDDVKTLTYKATTVAGEDSGLAAPKVTGHLLYLSAGAKAPGGSTRIRIEASDGKHPPAVAELQVTVTSSEADPPVAIADPTQTIKEGETATVNVVSNDQVAKGLRGKIEGAPQASGGKGTVRKVDDQTISYSAAKGDRFVHVTYVLTDDGEHAPGATRRSAAAGFDVVVYGRPGRPGVPSGTVASRSVSLAWNAAADNGLDISGYRVEAKVDGGSTLAPKTATGTRLVWDGLQPGKQYQFRVGAMNVQYGENDIADESWSGWSESFKPDQKPDQPAAPTVAFPSPGQNAGGAGGVLIVSLKAGTSQGSPIDYYTVGTDSGATRRVPAGASLTVSYDGLTNGVPYAFWVTAHNAEGDSERSPLSATETPAGVPGAVTGIAVANPPGGDPSFAVAVVTFSPGADNGAAVDYRVEVSGQVTVSNAAPGGTTVSPLRPPGGPFAFRVIPHNRAGDGLPAELSATAVTNPSTPGAPTATPGDGTAAVRWAAPGSTGGGSGLHYVVTASTGVVTTTTAIELPQVQTPNDQPVSFTVKACVDGKDDSFCSPDSAASAPVTPYGDPAVTARTSGTTVTWSWPRQPGVTSYSTSLGTLGGCCTAVYEAGPGEPRTFTATITAQGPAGTRTVTVPAPPTADSRRLTATQGTSAAGLPSQEGGPCTTACRWIAVTATGFRTGTTYSGACWGDFGGSSSWLTFSFKTDGNGSWSGEPCYFGYPGYSAWVVVDGIESNHVPF